MRGSCAVNNGSAWRQIEGIRRYPPACVPCVRLVGKDQSSECHSAEHAEIPDVSAKSDKHKIHSRTNPLSY